VNLVAVIPGASPQLFVLTAPYDTRGFDSFRFVAANDGASAPGLLLELARVIQARPLPYPTWIVVLDREAPRAGDTDAAPEPLLAGSSVLARELLGESSRAPVRLVLSFQQVGMPTCGSRAICARTACSARSSGWPARSGARTPSPGRSLRFSAEATCPSSPQASAASS
jgi:hypothetical protein